MDRPKRLRSTAAASFSPKADASVSHRLACSSAPVPPQLRQQVAVEGAAVVDVLDERPRNCGSAHRQVVQAAGSRRTPARCPATRAAPQAVTFKIR